MRLLLVAVAVGCALLAPASGRHAPRSFEALLDELDGELNNLIPTTTTTTMDTAMDSQEDVRVSRFIVPPNSPWQLMPEHKSLEEEEEEETTETEPEQRWPGLYSETPLRREGVKVASNVSDSQANGIVTVNLNYVRRTEKYSHEPDPDNFFVWVFNPSEELNEARVLALNQFDEYTGDYQQLLETLRSHMIHNLWPVLERDIMSDKFLWKQLGEPDGLMLISDDIFQQATSKGFFGRPARKERANLSAIARAASDRTCLSYQCPAGTTKKELAGSRTCTGGCTTGQCCFEVGVDLTHIDEVVDSEGVRSCLAYTGFPMFHIDHQHQPLTLGQDVVKLDSDEFETTVTERGPRRGFNFRGPVISKKRIMFDEMYNAWMVLSERLCTSPLGVLSADWREHQGPFKAADVYLPEDMFGGEFLLFRTRDTLHGSIPMSKRGRGCEECRKSVDFRFVTYKVQDVQ